jgi:membrane dipeptidase
MLKAERGDPFLIVDAHEDLAINMLTFERDYRQSVSQIRASEIGTEVPSRNGQALLGWPDWIKGDIAVVFATITAVPERHRSGVWQTQCYRDADEAYHLYRNQLAIYHQLVEERSSRFTLILNKSDLHQLLRTWQEGSSKERALGLVILMEGADAVREPNEIFEWHANGVRIVGPAWSGTRYAGGTGEPGPLTDTGRELLDRMAEIGMILDLSHMAREAAWEAVESYSGVLIASHSNPLPLGSLLSSNSSSVLSQFAGSPDRYLSDPLILRIAEHQGVIGIMPCNFFLRPNWQSVEGRNSITLDDVVIAIDHICQLVGNSAHVGLGTDFEGGFGLESIPLGIESVADLKLIGEALLGYGYKPSDVKAILGGNWLGLLERALPET